MEAPTGIVGVTSDREAFLLLQWTFLQATLTLQVLRWGGSLGKGQDTGPLTRRMVDPFQESHLGAVPQGAGASAPQWLPRHVSPI